MMPEMPEAAEGNPVPNLRATVEAAWMQADMTPLKVGGIGEMVSVGFLLV